MENINNIVTPETPIQPIETPITPEPTPTPSKSNLFKYLFIISIIVLLISIISFIFILNNKNTNQPPIQQNINDISEVTPTIIPTDEVINKVNNINQSVTPTIEKTPTITVAPSTKMTSDQIFQEASSQLGIVRSQFIYFRIFGQDRVQYSAKPESGTSFAYKLNGNWVIALKNAQDIAVCSWLENVPEKYRPPCYDNVTKTEKYLAEYGSSLNYPPAEMVSYIDQ